MRSGENVFHARIIYTASPAIILKLRSCVRAGLSYDSIGLCVNGSLCFRGQSVDRDNRATTLKRGSKSSSLTEICASLLTEYMWGIVAFIA